MTNSRSQSLATVRKLAQRAEQNAAEKLQARQLQLQRDQAQLAQVSAYHQDYLQQIDQQTSVGVAELVAYRNFAQHLSQSVAQLQVKVGRQEMAVGQAREQWQGLRQRRIAIDDLIERALNDEAMALDKLEQKQLDDLVTQQFHRNQKDQDETPDQPLIGD